jgi:non-ribosomal peptide synthetase component F
MQREQAEAREHEQAGLVEVAGWGEVGRGVQLFESLLAFENYPVDESMQETRLGFEVEDIQTSTQTNYPLTLSVIPAPDLLLRLAYDAKRFDESAVNELMAEFRAALHLLGARPEVTLAELNGLLDEQKRRRSAAAAEGLQQARGQKFRTVRRAVVRTEVVGAADSVADD